MELKNYQKSVMADLSAYMEAIDTENDLVKGWESYWKRKEIGIGAGGVPPYKNKIKGTPHVCMKVPTGGGKTFMACSAVKRIFDRLPADKPKFVVWLVPSDAILGQTIRTLSDVNHPYRQRLDMNFAGKVAVYTKDMLLNGQNFSPDTVRDTVSICIFSYASLRIDSTKKDVRKVYQENGNLFRFAEYFNDKSVLLADTPETALIQVMRCLSPVVVVDESHNAGSQLSEEMLGNLNPSFILELTATPRASSNIISYVDARELKKENMVKLPVVVFNRSSRQTVIQDAIQLRGTLEAQAKAEMDAGGKYIRPIVLFQAQPKTSEDSETFDKIKQMLIEMGIPENQIGIKTSKIDDISKLNLLSPECDIRYIITVNALKEGWDCPFAYILASLANKTSKVDVEQILGRILRQPYAKQHQSKLLNTSFVLTSSNDFHATLESIVTALNKSGFSRKDYRVAEDAKTLESVSSTVDGKQAEFTLEDFQSTQEEDYLDDFSDINTEEVKSNTSEVHDHNLLEQFGSPEEGESNNDSGISEMVDMASKQAEQYDEQLKGADEFDWIGGELGDMLKQNAVQEQFREEIKELRIPQFFMQSTPDLFGNEYEPLEPENLSEGFSLQGQDAQISFELATGELYSVDIQSEGEAVPKYKKASKSDSEYFQKVLEHFPPEERLKQSADMISRQVNKNNRYSTSDVTEYVKRVISGMKEEELAVIETSIPVYASKILRKIESLEQDYRIGQFKKWIDSGKIVAQERYKLKDSIAVSSATSSIPDSLYEAEKDDMNNFERSVIDSVVALDNIRWWHRIIERNDFRLNGFINHYPDFMVMTKSGKLVLIETKGDHLDGEDSKRKAELGRRWAGLSGNDYRYFMVFKEKNLGVDGSYTLDQFIEIMKSL